MEWKYLKLALKYSYNYIPSLIILDFDIKFFYFLLKCKSIPTICYLSPWLLIINIRLSSGKKHIGQFLLFWGIFLEVFLFVLCTLWRKCLSCWKSSFFPHWHNVFTAFFGVSSPCLSITYITECFWIDVAALQP